MPCGIVRPISELEQRPPTHWEDVHSIIREALANTQFEPSLVSDANESGIIQARIVQRLADDPIVICDVSTKNPNVMFELGLRLAFDLPTVVIKDDKTSYSFDTGIVEHLTYPRDLRYQQIQTFKEKLARKVTETHQKKVEDENYSTFLKHFVKLTPKKLPKKKADALDVILSELRTIQAILITQKVRPYLRSEPRHHWASYRTTVPAHQIFLDTLVAQNISPDSVRREGNDNYIIQFNPDVDLSTRKRIDDIAESLRIEKLA